MFELWPFTNFHDMNLDWIIKTVLDWVKKMQKVEDDWQEFIDSTYKEQITEILEDHPEWVTTVMDGAITAQKLMPSFLQEVLNPFVTPEMYGAEGDGVNDDTNAIQAALDSGKIVVFGNKTYATTDTINIGGYDDCTVYAGYSTIEYNGANAAVNISGMNGGNIKLGQINAPYGSCIEVASSTGTSDRTQYCRISFNRLSANDVIGDAFRVHVTGTGWANQNTVECGEIVHGLYGIHIISDASSATYNINGWTFNQPGFEGCINNVFLDARNTAIQGVTFNGARHVEHTSSPIMITTGTISRVIYESWGEIPIDTRLTLNGTISRTEFIAPIVENNLTVGKAYYKRDNMSNWQIIRAFDSTTEQTINSLSFGSNATVTLTSPATGACTIYRAGFLRLMKLSNIIVTSNEGDLSTNLIPEAYRPIAQTEFILLSDDASTVGRGWIRTSGTIAFKVTDTSKKYNATIAYIHDTSL